MIHAEFLCIIATFAMAQATKPEALQRMEQSRQAIVAARFEWSRIDQTKASSGKDRELFHTTRFSGADQLEIHHGDSDGVMSPDKIGEDLSCSELRFLRKGNEEWWFRDDTFKVSIATSPARFQGMFDVRTLGMVPATSGRMTTAKYLPDEPESYEETVEGAIHRVKAKFPQGVVVSWDIDAGKNYSPIKCVMTQHGKTIRSVDCDYEQFEGVWFPVQTTFYQGGVETSRILINDASFSTDDDARELTPHDLGILPGTTVARDNDPTYRMWDGDKAIPPMEYFNAVKAGKIDNTHFAAFIERTKTEGQGRHPKQYDDATYGLVGVERTPGLWEEYVRRFIRKHKLDRPNTRKAWRHHKVCQTEALKYLKEHRGELDELDRELEKARAGGESQANAVKAAEARRNRKLGPITKIFEDRLKPGLNKLVKPKEPAATVATPASPVTTP